ncbi:MAG: dihydroorotate dehydrogenase electron transfer subunit [Fidelibacterota bacterium]
MKRKEIQLNLEDANIVSNLKLSNNIWRLTMDAPRISRQYKGPGQFIGLSLNDSWEHPIRRPMSIARVDGKYIDIIYKIFGSVTKELSMKSPGDFINILGPIGNVFTEWTNENRVLIAGGVGLAPILNLYETCPNSTLIIGAKTANEHFMLHEPERNVYLATDDGSVGIQGTVLDALRHITLENQTIIYACGPEPMLKAIQEFTEKNNIKAQLSVESYMGCGIGVCQGCVIRRENGKIHHHSYHKQYSLVCVEGPIYWSHEVSFD